MSFGCNALIIFSTIHAQDFRDEIGDRMLGRKTLPIVWPEFSRVAILALMTAWSVGLSVACEINVYCSLAFCTLAAFVGTRFYVYRDVEADKRSYLYYNVRFTFPSFISSC